VDAIVSGCGPESEASTWLGDGDDHAGAGFRARPAIAMQNGGVEIDGVFGHQQEFFAADLSGFLIIKRVFVLGNAGEHVGPEDKTPVRPVEGYLSLLPEKQPRAG
jgi:hypothetical protein